MKYILLIFALLFSCEQSALKQGTYGEDLLTYAPYSSDFVFYINASDVRNSKFAKEEIDQHSDELFHEGRKYYDKFVKLTGLDPEKDVESFLLAGDSKNIEENKSAVFIAKGNFDEAKIISFVKNIIAEEADEDIVEFSEEDIAGKKVYRLKKKENVNGKDLDKIEEFACSFISKNIIVFSAYENIETVLSAKNNLADNKAMLAKIKQVNGHQMYAVVNAEQFKSKVNGNAQAEKVASFVEDISFALNFDAEMTLSMVSNCIKEEQAELLKEMLEGLVATAKLAVSDERELIDLMQEVDIESKSKRISVSLTVDQDRLKKLKKYSSNIKKNVQKKI